MYRLGMISLVLVYLLLGTATLAALYAWRYLAIGLLLAVALILLPERPGWNIGGRRRKQVPSRPMGTHHHEGGPPHG